MLEGRNSGRQGVCGPAPSETKIKTKINEIEKEKERG